MLISIHSRAELTVELEPAGTPRRSMFIDIGEGQSILINKDEAERLYLQLGGALDELERDAADQAELADLAVIDSLPMFEVESA